MRFKYVENCKAGFVTLHGVTFRHGEAVDVTCQELVSKLLSNNHFEAVDKAETPHSDDENLDTIVEHIKRRGRPPKVQL